MYRTTDPRFRRRLHELGATLESANETAQSSLYIFGQNYVQPCLASVGNCLAGCVEASCPGGRGDGGTRARRQRGRVGDGGGGVGRGRAELSFDFYDDWDTGEEETEGLLGWGDFGEGVGYGTVAAQTTTASQPGRQRGMSYPKGRRKSGDVGVVDSTGMPVGKNGFWGRLFGGKTSRYRPSAEDLQEHPGTRRLARDITEGEALLEESGEDGQERMMRRHGRARSGTQASHETGSSYSSRGDLFPSDNEDDAIPLDDEFAMVLERRTTQSGMDTENSSNKTDRKRGKRPSAGSRTSTRRTFSSRSSKSERDRRSRTNSHAAQTPTVMDEASVTAMSEAVALKDEAFAKEAMHSSTFSEPPPSMSELKQQERALEMEEEAAIERKRQEAYRAAAERGLTIPPSPNDHNPPQSSERDSGKEETRQVAVVSGEEPSQLPTPTETDDEQDGHHAARDEGNLPAERKGKDGSD